MNLTPLPDACIDTERCSLEPQLATHAEPLFQGFRDPALYRWIPTDPPTKPEDLRRRFQRLQTRTSGDKQQLWLNWAVRLNDAQTYVGTVEATVFADRTAQLAYFVFAKHQRRGYATEACWRILEHLFNGYEVERVFLLVDTRNISSIALAEKLGFVRTATIPNADSFKGLTSDEYRYEIQRAAHIHHTCANEP